MKKLLRRLLLILALAGCRSGYTPQVQDAIAIAANAGGETILAIKCTQELAAIHHTGGRLDGQCTRTDDPRPATEAELVELRRVRDKWVPIAGAYAALQSAHDAWLALSPNAPDSERSRGFAALLSAYQELARVARRFGVPLPTLPKVE